MKQKMKLIIGLGNPGKKYEKTPHNVGFMAIDELANKLNLQFQVSKFNAQIAANNNLILAKPLTYMNLSGHFLSAFINYFRIPIENVLVIHDDVALPLGKIRLRQESSHGGHNGMKNIIAQIGTKKVNRIKIGVGQPTDKQNLVNHVLHNLSKEELTIIKENIVKIVPILEDFATLDFNEIMERGINYYE